MYYVLHTTKLFSYICITNKLHFKRATVFSKKPHRRNEGLKPQNRTSHFKPLKQPYTMKPVLRIIGCCTLLFASLALSAQSPSSITVNGRTVDTTGKAIGFATIILKNQADTTRTYGAASDTAGRFSLRAPSGEYRLQASFLGYEPVEKVFSLKQTTHLGDLVLQPSAIGMEAVVVKGEMITREADRFVVNVANTPLAIGQTAKEMLQISPGVWVDEKNGLSVNGKSNPQVIINDRIVRETGEDLINYLSTIKAEDIQRIEVIPMGGVEYDASSQGGVIKITLRRQRENGLEGSLSMRYGVSLTRQFTQYIQPSFTLNYMVNKWRFYTTLSENNWQGNGYQNLVTRYDNGNTLQILNQSKNRNDWPRLRAGSVYEINDRHSVGIELNMRGYFPGKSDNVNQSEEINNGQTTWIDEQNVNRWKNKSFNVTANYIAKLDTVGSQFKLLVDYYHNRSLNWGDNQSHYTGAWLFDSITDSYSNTLSNLYSVTGDFEIKIGSKSRLKTGLKYSYRDLSSDNRWNYFQNEVAHPISDLTFINGYTENIAALYGNYSVRFANKISLSAGIRGEYTYATPRQNTLTGIDPQNYFSFFPNANLSIPLDSQENHTLIFSYARKINRPWYRNLIPYRESNGNNMYFEGNPHLKPAYANDYSISWVFKRRYNLTLGVQQVTDAISQVITSETSESSTALVVIPDNLQKNNIFYASLNLPVEVTPWWKINANLMGGYMQSSTQEIEQTQWSFRGNMSNTFTLTKNLYYILEGRYCSPVIQSNIKALSTYDVSTSVRYSFLKNKLSVTLYLNDIFNSSSKQRLIVFGSGFRTDGVGQWDFRRLGLSLRYNFKSGKEFRAKQVESGEAQESQSQQGGGGLGR